MGRLIRPQANIMRPDFYVAPHRPTRYENRMRIFAQVLGMSFLLAVATVSAAAPTQTELLTRPASDGPFVVQTGFQLLDITMIDDQSETFEFTGTLTIDHARFTAVVSSGTLAWVAFIAAIRQKRPSGE